MSSAIVLKLEGRQKVSKVFPWVELILWWKEILTCRYESVSRQITCKLDDKLLFENGENFEEKVKCYVTFFFFLQCFQKRTLSHRVVITQTCVLTLYLICQVWALPIQQCPARVAQW